MRIVIALIITIFASAAMATSDQFPPSGTTPLVGDFIATPSDTFYCSPSGDNATGDGSIGNPWVDFIGASGNCGPGDLIYFRGGTYPTYSHVNAAYCANRLTDDGTEANPIVITNYPGEIVYYDDNTEWSLSLGGDYQKLIGTDVSGDYGWQINGGITISGANYSQVSNIEIYGGAPSGDLNPAMIYQASVTNDYGNVISYNYFHDAINIPSSSDRVTGIRMFVNANSIIEFNLFENMNRYSYGSAIYFKDVATEPIVRYNTFIDCLAAIGFGGQGDDFNGLSVHHNLFYDAFNTIVYLDDLNAGSSEPIEIYNNVSLSIPAGGAFYRYYNFGNDTYQVHGDFYNNVIDGPAFSNSWNVDSNNMDNLPDFFDYNLWYDAADTSTVVIIDGNDTPAWTLPSAYSDNAVVSSDSVSYNSETMKATVPDDWDGRGTGLESTNIGGFTWTSSMSLDSASVSGGVLSISWTDAGSTEWQVQATINGTTSYTILVDSASASFPVAAGTIDIKITGNASGTAQGGASSS